MRYLRLYLIAVSDYLVASLLIPTNTLQQRPVDIATTHILYHGMESTKHPFADIHRMIDLPHPLHSVVPHVPDGALAMVPRIV